MKIRKNEIKSTHILRGGEELEDGAALGENLRAGASVVLHGLEYVGEDGGDLDQGLAGGGNTGNVDENVQRGRDNLQRQNITGSLNIVIITSLCGSDLLHLAISETSCMMGDPDLYMKVILVQQSRDSLVDMSRVLTALMS